MKKKKKVKVVYYADKGETIYSMAALEGRTPEEQEEAKKAPAATAKAKAKAVSSRGLDVTADDFE